MKRKLFLASLLALTVATAWLVVALSAQTIDPVERPDGGGINCNVTGYLTPTVALTITGTNCDGINLGGLLSPISPPTGTKAAPPVDQSPISILNLLDDTPPPAPELVGVEAAFGPLWADIEAAQDDFYSLYGRYWQGLTIGPDIATTYPSDQAVTWSDFLDYTPTTTYTLRIDTYNGPAGPGYVAVLTYDIWQAAINHGLLDFGHDWRLIEVDE